MENLIMPTKKLYLALGDAGINILKTASTKQVSKGHILLINTDKSLFNDAANLSHILIGKKILKGHPAGGIKFGEKAIDESFHQIMAYINDHKANKIIILAGVRGGTGGNAVYLANKLLKHKLSVGLGLSGIFSFEAGGSSNNADLVINQAKELQKELLFLEIFNPTQLIEELKISRHESFENCLEKINLHIWAEIKSL